MAEFYPDSEQRSQLHYQFAHVFLRDCMQVDRLSLILEGRVEPVQFVQTRWALMEQLHKHLPHPNFARQIADLSAWSEIIAGHPAFLIEMPRPKTSSLAFFAGAVLLAPAEEFQVFAEKVQAAACSGGFPPSPQERERFASFPGRYFTAEYYEAFPPEIINKAAIMCAWRGPAQHQLFPMPIEANRQAFAAAIAELLRTTQ